MIFVDYKNGSVLPAPKMLIIDKKEVWFPSDEQYIKAGYKEAVLADEPKDGYYECVWKEEKEKVYQVWIKAEDPSKGGIDPDQAWKIISSSSISKEDKEKLYKYIYAKEE